MSSTHSRGSSMDFRSEAVESRSEIAFAPTVTEGSLHQQPDSTIHFDDDSRVGDTTEAEIASSSDGTPRSPHFISEREDVGPHATSDGAKRGSSAESFTRSDAAKNISASPPPRSLAMQQDQGQTHATVNDPSPSPTRAEGVHIGGDRHSPRSEHSIAISGTEASVNFFHDEEDDNSMVLSPLRTPPPPPPPTVLSPEPSSASVADQAAASQAELTTPKPSPPSRRPPSTKPLTPGSPQRDVIVKAPPVSVPEAPTTPLAIRRSASQVSDGPKPPAIRQAEHAQTWDSSPAAKPHHALYQPSQVQRLEEEEFAKNFPYWNKPKGATSVKLAGGGLSSDGDTKPLIMLSNASRVEAADLVVGDEDARQQHVTKLAVHPVDDLRSKAKEFSDKLRREHREANRTETSLNSSTTFHCHQESSIAFEMIDSVNVGPPHDDEAEAETLTQSHTSRRSGSGRRGSPERQESVQSWLHGVAADERNTIKNAPRVSPLSNALETPRQTSAAKSSFQEYAEVNLSPRSSNSGEQAHRESAAARTEALRSSSAAAAPQDSKEGTQQRTTSAVRTTPRRVSQPEQSQPQRRPSTPGRPQTPLRRGSAASSSQPQQASAPHTTENLEARRRKFFLIYGQRKGQEFFERFLNENNLQDPNPPSETARRGSAPRSRNLTPASRRPSPSSGPQQAECRETTPARRSAWDRLYRTQIHHPTHSPTREALHLPSPADPRSQSQSAGRQRASTPPDPKVFTKLYQVGLDEKARRQKLFVEGQRKREEKELSEAVDAVILAKVLRSTAGHKSMTKTDLEAMLTRERKKYLESILLQRSKSGERRVSQPTSRSGTPGSQAGGSRPPTPRSRPSSPVRVASHELNLSAEPLLTQDGIDEMTNRLFKLGRRKFAEEEKRKADQELAGCTFTPRINGGGTPLRRASTPNTRSGSAGGRSAVRVAEPPQRPSNRSATPDRCKALYSYSQREKSNHDVNRDRVIREQKTKILKSKLESDHHFKRRVAADPALAEKFMASLTCV
jgi:hypothetical protein